MSIKDLETRVESAYYTEEFMKFIEDNISYFSGAEDLEVREFVPAKSYKHEGDFYGLCNYLNIPPHLHYLTMRLNGYKNPIEFAGDRNAIVYYKGGQDNIIARALTVKVR